VVRVKVVDMTNELLNHLENKQRQGRNNASFKALDPGEIAKMSDKELAAWSTQQDADSPQRTLAIFEWQRRLNKQLVEGTLKGAWVGVVGVLLGAILGAILTLLAGFISSNKNDDKRYKKYQEVTLKNQAPAISGDVTSKDLPPIQDSAKKVGKEKKP
jgi:hypothetical protein